MRRIASFVGLLGLAARAASAAPPSEVPPDAAFDADKVTLRWSAAPAATTHDVYRATDPTGGDRACRVVHAVSTSAVLDEIPPAGGAFYFLVAGVNGDGEGTLGDDSSGAPRPYGAPCADVDLDLVPDNLDNCPGDANASQADQDENGVGDRCDPATYDFEADALGAIPAGTTRVGPLNQALTVKDDGGDRVVSFDAAGVGASQRFDRVDAPLPLQDTTVWVDVQDVPQVVSLELWSDGAWGWNAGGGAILQIQTDHSIRYYDRIGQSVPAQIGPLLPPNGRLRLRLVKGPGNTSTLHVDTHDGTDWVVDTATFPVADDHRYLGRATVVADYFGGPRAIRRITVRPALPPAPLTLIARFDLACDWKLFQRDAGGVATLPVRFAYRLVEPGSIEARVVPSSGGGPLPGHDYADHRASLPVADGAYGALDLAGVPAGGNYDVEVRLVRASDGAVLGQGTIAEVAVGDVYLAGGQSNMSGYSGGLVGAETPVDEVHLFGNDDRWKRASEPMDDGTDQVDLVSSEAPAHSLMLRFAKEMRQATGVPIAVIPGPLGGTNLYSQWQRDAADHADRGTLYGSLLYRAIAQGYGAPPAGFLWYQGESDAGRGTALYRQDLERLIAQYREDLASPALPFGIVQLATYDGSDYTTWIPIQEAQRQVVESDPRTVLAAAVDLPRNDVIHLNVDGYKTIGTRLANEMREHLLGQPIDASARLTVARVVGNNRKIELVYDRPVTGGAATLYRVAQGPVSVAVNSVSVSGSVVTLSLGSRVDPGARVSYGYARSPAASWVKDGAGTAVAVFQDVPVE